MKTTTYLLISVAAIVTAVIGIKSTSQPITVTALGFIAWAVSPYVYLWLMAKWAPTNAAKSAVLILSLLVASFGIWFIVDAMFIHPDAQGSLVYIFAPLMQWALPILASATLYFLNRVKDA